MVSKEDFAKIRAGDIITIVPYSGYIKNLCDKYGTLTWTAKIIGPVGVISNVIYIAIDNKDSDISYFRIYKHRTKTNRDIVLDDIADGTFYFGIKPKSIDSFKFVKHGDNAGSSNTDEERGGLSFL